MKQIPLAMLPQAAPSFDSFMAGPNGAALQHLQRLNVAAAAAPVYLWGASGSGKTHLLQALAHHYQQQGLAVGWIDPRIEGPWTVDESWSLMVLDDCSSFNEQQQQWAFAAFVDASALAMQIAAAGGAPPVDLNMRDDLRTRLAWGHVFALQPLAEAQVRSVLRREADQRGIFLSDEVMSYLLTHFERDLKHLMQWLDRLDEFALSRHRAVTVPLLKTMLAENEA